MKLNIGCGNRNFGNEWIHIDGANFKHIDNSDIYLKTFKNNSVDLIYSSHFIEYFDRDDVKKILIKWRKVLKKNGILRIAVPNFKTCAELYTKGLYPLDNFLGPLYGRMKMSNKLIYHKTVYDFESIKDILLNIGMRNITIYDWRDTEHAKFDDHSQAYLPHMDKTNGTLISLNVESVK